MMNNRRGDSEVILRVVVDEIFTDEAANVEFSAYIADRIRRRVSLAAADVVWSRKLLGMIPGSIHAPIVGVDEPVAEPARKRELHRATGAAAVDMESHLEFDSVCLSGKQEHLKQKHD